MLQTIAGKLLGGAAAEPIEAVGKVLDGLFTSDEERLDRQALLARLAQQPALAQIELNKVEAAHRSIFVAGWRPFIGWVCGAALAYNFVVRDLVAWVLLNSGAHASLPPALQMEQLLTIVLSLLGLAGMRSLEKGAGKAK